MIKELYVFYWASIFALLISISSCSSNNNSATDPGIQTISIAVDTEVDNTFSQLVDSISFIPLETNNEALIGYASKIRVKDSRIYILDKYRSKCLFVFDRMGKYLFKVDKVGKGPGEYTDASGFCVSEQGEIILSDFEGKKILFYNGEGKFLREIFPDFNPSDIAYLGDGLIAISSYYPNYRVNILSVDGETIRKEFVKNGRHGYVYNNELVSCYGNVLFRDYYEDTIYQVTKDITLKRYFIDFQEKKMTLSYYMSIPITTRNGISSRIIPEGLRFGCFNPVETGEYFSFYFWETPQRFNRHWCLYNKKSGHTTYMNVNMDFDDLFGDRDPTPIKAATKDLLCFPLDSYKLLGRWQKTMKNFADKKPEALEQLKTLKAGLTNNSNPVLVLFTLKPETY